MSAFYDITTKIKDHFVSDPFINTVHYNDIDGAELKKMQIYPLANMVVNSLTEQGPIIRVQMEITIVDIVYDNKDIDTGFYGNDNTMDVDNGTSMAHFRLSSLLRRGDLNADKFQLANNPVCNPVQGDEGNNAQGMRAIYEIDIPNEMCIS